MSIIVWDGKTLAADKRATQNGLAFTVTKIHKINGNLVGVTGDYPSATMVLDWYKNGADATKWPKCQEDKDRWASLAVITPARKIFKYEQEPISFEIEENYFAFGCGRDFAISALEMGADAEAAVRVTCKYDVYCGNGVDILRLDEDSK